MLRVERAGKRLIAFESLRSKPIAEFYDLTDFIVNSPKEFFGEVGEDLFVIGVNVPLASGSSPVDLLAVDRDGASVAAVIETSAEESPLSRAITAAGRIASWSPDDFWKRLSPAASRELKQFLAGNVGRINTRQRVLVIGETPDEELLSVASWLRQRGVDIAAIRTSFGIDPITGAEYLRCQREEPPIAAIVPSSTPATRGFEASQPKSAAATAVAAGPPVGLDERRRSDRSEDFSVRDLRVEYAGRRMSAALADYSAGGVGLHMHSPLPTGAKVTVHGYLEGPEGEVRLASEGRIRHCRFGEKAFRLGVAFNGSGVSEN
ncbi:MAG: hypothetical protein GC160_26850 [Acidobacteria bacterium]|nr:hypothetical protein [Acidobacteriota bacterium]